MNRRIADEQAALRRVAVLAARAASPDTVFAAVAEEAGRLLGVGHAVLNRYDRDGVASVVAAWSSVGAPPVTVGTRVPVAPPAAEPTPTAEPTAETRPCDCADDPGTVTRLTRQLGLGDAVSAPVSVEGRVWGVLMAASAGGRPMPEGTEARLAAFTELAATAIASTQAREELRGFAEEQAALRRVATLVARRASPDDVFTAVTEEAGRLLHAEHTSIGRYNPDDTYTVAAAWARAGPVLIPVGARLPLNGRNAPTLVFETSRPGQVKDYTAYSGEIGEIGLAGGVRASVGVPVSVEGRLWGVMLMASVSGPLPADAELRLSAFTELAATAIASTQAREELRGFAEEQAALRRVATLVARRASPDDVFTAVTEEAGRLLHADYTVLSRYDPDGLVTVIGGWAAIPAGHPPDVGLRLKPAGRNIPSLVFQTGQAARMDDYDTASGGFGAVARSGEFRASVGVPIRVDGRLWGVISAVSRSGPLPADAEDRLAGFTDLAATALANAEAQAALTASRARIVAAADASRRRIERDLHDGAQQRLVSLALRLRAAQASVPPGTAELTERLEVAVGEATGVQEELREISRGLHPAILTEGGLRPALRALARRCAVPVRVEVQVTGRLSEPTEIAAYCAVSEALANTVRHARASAAVVEAVTGDGWLLVRVRDDGCGGADFSGGAGLTGLRDRAESLGGRVSLHSPSGAGTSLEITLPLDAHVGPAAKPLG